MIPRPEVPQLNDEHGSVNGHEQIMTTYVKIQQTDKRHKRLMFGF